jgi:hypothetical protein
MAAKKPNKALPVEERLATKKPGEVIDLIGELRNMLGSELQDEPRKRSAPKKATAIVPTMLRLREDLRKRLEREATKHARSLNAEMVRRLQMSLALDEHFEREREIMRLGLKRETALIEALIGDKMIAAFLRSVALLMMNNPDWAETEHGRQAMAQAINQRLDLIKPANLRLNSSEDDTFDFESSRLPPRRIDGDEQ